jgi:hypothetical protein
VSSSTDTYAGSSENHIFRTPPPHPRLATWPLRRIAPCPLVMTMRTPFLKPTSASSADSASAAAASAPA